MGYSWEHGTRGLSILVAPFLLACLTAGWPGDSAGTVPPSPVAKTVRAEWSRVETMDNNARLWWSMNQALGRTSLWIGEAGADGHWAGRLGQFLGLAYLNLAVGHYTHELGHNVWRRGWSIDASDWSLWPWPRFSHGRCLPGRCDDEEERLKLTAAGLNVEEYDAYLAHRLSLGGMSFDESMAFAFRKLSTLTYDLYTGELFGLYPEGDVTQYKGRLRARGIGLSGPAFALQAALSDVLTWRLWEAVAGNWAYLRHGARESRSRTLVAGRWTLLPPLVNFYLTPGGGFYDVAIFADPPGPGWLETHLGLDADFLGGGRVNRLRLGGAFALGPARQSGAFPASQEGASLAPFFYCTMRRTALAPVGWNLGVEGISPAFLRASLTARVEYGSGDLLEHTVKWKSRGMLATLGMAVSL